MLGILIFVLGQTCLNGIKPIHGAERPLYWEGFFLAFFYLILGFLFNFFEGCKGEFQEGGSWVIKKPYYLLLS